MFVTGCFFDNLTIGSLDCFYKNTFNILALALRNLFDHHFHSTLGSIISCLMATHTIRYHEQVLENTQWFSRRKDVVLIYLSHHSNICN